MPQIVESMRAAIKTFDETFGGFVSSGYVFPTTESDMAPGIKWYNDNIQLITMCNLVPIEPIVAITADTYQWAYSCGLLTCANMKSNLNRMQM